MVEHWLDSPRLFGQVILALTLTVPAATDARAQDLTTIVDSTPREFSRVVGVRMLSAGRMLVAVRR